MQAMFRYGAIFRFSLIQKFWIAASVTIVISMVALAYAVSLRFEVIAMQAAADEGALLVGTFLGPEVQELASGDSLSATTARRLDERLRGKLGERVKVIKIWLRDGTLVYATNGELVGQRFPSSHLDAAFSGQVSGSFDELDDPENQFERELKTPLIEIYAPFYRTGTTEVIAVGEIYNDGTRLAADLRRIGWTTAIVVGAITAPMMSVLFALVWRANTIVTRNRESLSRKIEEARNLALQNDQLRREADDARLEVIQSNEQLLGSIGQDLHDGPIQMLSILMLKLSDSSTANNSASASPRSAPTQKAADLAADALSELRDISTGLVLPQLEGLTAEETLLLAVRRHENLTGTTVEREIDDLAFYPAVTLRTCLFRVVQEGLNNAFHYANGNGQHVAATIDDRWIVITVSDRGRRTADSQPAARRRTGLGLPGLRRRAEALGGSLTILQQADGTQLRVALPMMLIDTENTALLHSRLH
jgi:signal transduction histidine kinase